MSNTPLVSVVVATYNMGQYVSDAINSILKQDYKNVEVIVVDDGSTDDTPRRLEKYNGDRRVKLIHQQNAGQSVAKNLGLKNATGDYIGFCDADNLWFSNKLSRQFSILNQMKKPIVVYSDGQDIDGEGRSLPTRPKKRYSGRITGQLLIDNFVTFNTVLIPRCIFEEVGVFDESLQMGIDYDLWLRISVKYEFHYLPEPLISYRIWSGQMSHRTEERFNNVFRLMTNFLQKYSQSVTKAEIKRGWAQTYVSRGLWKASQKQYRRALQDYFYAFRYRPYDWRMWKSLIKICIGR